MPDFNCWVMLEFKIAVIGDIHRCWDDIDLAFFNNSDYDVIVFVGDLPGRTHRGLLDMARRLANIKKPAYFMPGNHDGVAIRQLLAELQNNDTRRHKHVHRQLELCKQLREALHPIQMIGYSCHSLTTAAGGLDMIAARPHSMGGPIFSYGPYLEKIFNVYDFDSSRDKIIAQFKASQASTLLVIGHNGPTGLGSRRDSIWGKDFGKEPDDFGDRDLKEAIDFALVSGKNILTVVAGHMHLQLKRGGRRESVCKKDDIVYINSACVPRIFKHTTGMVRHHVRLHFQKDQVLASEILVDDDGRVVKNFLSENK